MSARPTLKARKVALTFEGVTPAWNTVNPEFGTLSNAMSTLLPYLEPFFIKTARALQENLPEDAHDLRRDVSLFVFQEGRHHRNHSRFNEIIRAATPGPVAAAEARAKRFYRWMDRRSPKFALGYSDGFETVAPLVALYFFENAPKLGLTDLENPTVYLLLWHFAEEYEHRTVCYSLFRQLYGDHWYRIATLWFATAHFLGYSVRLALELLPSRATGASLKEAVASRLRFARLLAGIAWFAMPRLVTGPMRRGYDPATLEPPPALLPFLEEVTERFGEHPVSGSSD